MSHRMAGCRKRVYIVRSDKTKAMILSTTKDVPEIRRSDRVDRKRSSKARGRRRRRRSNRLHTSSAFYSRGNEPRRGPVSLNVMGGFLPLGRCTILRAFTR